MGRITGEQNTALDEHAGHALAYRIDRAIVDLVFIFLGKEALHARLERLRTQRLFLGFALATREHRAPDTLRTLPLDLEQVAPFKWVGKISARTQAGKRLFKVIEGRNFHETLGVSEPFKRAVLCF